MYLQSTYVSDLYLLFVYWNNNIMQIHLSIIVILKYLSWYGITGMYVYIIY